ncbi:hypothetical protein E1212_26810 [Jiangella ureilytica]|uniref:Uncharacterized protein n=1 Tax=Jiangella ureilytica TaxID=2530374 RepID=A0A4R4RCS8_9ACTN|nr:hypothetical protein [Jiangella ureilytica]TDC46479.1 hypothetical protein E1212_26810 [Jiangella ureilytica]
MSVEPAPSVPPPPPPPPGESRPRRWVWPLVAVLALIVGAAAGIGIGLVIDDDESRPAAQRTPSPAATGGEGGESDELEQLRDRLGQVEEQRDDLKRRLDEARAELETRATETPDEPLESEPTPFEGEFTVGDFTFTDVEVLRDFAGDFEVRATVRNDGDSEAEFVSLAATVLNGGETVSTLTTSISALAAGDSVDAQFIGFDDYGDWDAVEFSVDGGSATTT